MNKNREIRQDLSKFSKSNKAVFDTNICNSYCLSTSVGILALGDKICINNKQH